VWGRKTYSRWLYSYYGFYNTTIRDNDIEREHNDRKNKHKIKKSVDRMGESKKMTDTRFEKTPQNLEYAQRG